MSLFTKKERDDLCYMHDNNPGALFDATGAAVLEKLRQGGVEIPVMDLFPRGDDWGKAILDYSDRRVAAGLEKPSAANAKLTAALDKINRLALVDPPHAMTWAEVAQVIVEVKQATTDPLPESAYCWNCGEPDPGCGGLFKKDGSACKFHGTAEVVS